MKKQSLKQRVDELEAQVAWLTWLIDKHVYQESPKYYFLDTVPKPDPLKGWNVT